MRPIALMYHRVAHPEIDPWNLAVSPRNFAEQLAVLRRSRIVLPTNDFVRRWSVGDLPANAVTLTFDDGYVDNLEFALPRLEAAEVPATLFVATGYLGNPHPYWWDELAELVLLRIEAEVIDLSVEETNRLTIGRRDAPSQTHRWRLAGGTHSTRQQALNSAWATLRDMDFAVRQELMARLRSLADPTSAGVGRPMTMDEVQRLAGNGLITIGAHTVTHPAMPVLSPERLADEISAGRAACEKIAGYPILGFAYPYGNEDERVRAAIRHQSFEYAFGVVPDATDGAADRYALPRIQVSDLDGDAFELLLQKFD